MWVTISTEDRPPRSQQVGTGVHVLGRAPDCDVVIDDDCVSSHHARLGVGADGVWLQDLESTNGTFVGGDRLREPVPLPASSKFRLGKTTVRLSAVEPTTLHSAVGDPSYGYPSGPQGPAAPMGSPSGPSYYVSDAGPVAGGDVRQQGRNVAGRDLHLHEGFKIRTRMRSSAKTCIRLGCVLFLAGFGLFGYFVLTWQGEIFDVISDPAAGPETQPDLPSPLPWLPLGAALMFGGIVLIVVGLLMPRVGYATRERRA
jgi:hypothetical protein